MIILGLTGSIACGKTTVSLMFKELGVKVFSDDLVAKKIQQKKNIKAKILNLFPEVNLNNQINLSKLRDIVLNDSNKLTALESIIHKEVNKKRKWFILKNKLFNNKGIILFDTALLFEANIDKLCDYKIVVICNKQQQLNRVLARNTLNIEQVNNIIKRQMPVEQKQQQADFIINTNISLEDTKLQVDNIYKKIKEKL
ncbi:dephospho-CoA kinase [Rickettsiales bacterium LUAb2]